MGKVTIADLNIEIDLMNHQFYYDRFQKYGNNGFEKNDLKISVSSCGKILIPEGGIIGQVKDTIILRLEKDRYCRYLVDSQSREIIQATFYNDTYSEVEIKLLNRVPETGLYLTEYEYMYTGFAFSDFLCLSGGAVLHGSLIAYENQGIVFSANSGIGKSTHAGLWKKYFGNKVAILNDDKPAIRFYQGVPYVFWTPWSGKSDLNENKKVQLKSIVFIRRADTNRIEKLSARNSIFNLMSQISRPFYDENLGLKTMDTIDRLVQSIPIYQLYCNVSHEAVETAWKQLRTEGVISK